MVKFRSRKYKMNKDEVAEVVALEEVPPVNDQKFESLEIEEATHDDKLSLANKKPAEVFSETVKATANRTSPNWAAFVDVAIGIDDENSSICLDRRADFNILISGTSGSGKSTLLRTIVAQYVGNSGPDDLRVLVLASSPTEFLQFSNISHLLTRISPMTKNYLNVFTWLVKEIAKRQTFLAKNNCRDFKSYRAKFETNEDDNFPEILVVIDDLSFIGDDSSEQVFERLSHILVHGRSVDVQVLLAAGTWILPAIAENLQFLFNSRIALKVTTRRESILAITVEGAQLLASPGKALVKRANKPQIVNTTLVHKSDSEIDSACNFWPAEKVNVVGQSFDATKNAQETLSNEDQWIHDAMKIMIEMKSCSVSVLQRKLGVSFARAVLVASLLEEQGYVSRTGNYRMLEIADKGLAFDK